MKNNHLLLIEKIEKRLLLSKFRFVIPEINNGVSRYFSDFKELMDLIEELRFSLTKEDESLFDKNNKDPNFQTVKDMFGF